MQGTINKKLHNYSKVYKTASKLLVVRLNFPAYFSPRVHVTFCDLINPIIK